MLRHMARSVLRPGPGGERRARRGGARCASARDVAVDWTVGRRRDDGRGHIGRGLIEAGARMGVGLVGFSGPDRGPRSRRASASGGASSVASTRSATSRNQGSRRTACSARNATGSSPYHGRWPWSSNRAAAVSGRAVSHATSSDGSRRASRHAASSTTEAAGQITDRRRRRQRVAGGGAARAAWSAAVPRVSRTARRASLGRLDRGVGVARAASRGRRRRRDRRWSCRCPSARRGPRGGAAATARSPRQCRSRAHSNANHATGVDAELEATVEVDRALPDEASSPRTAANVGRSSGTGRIYRHWSRSRARDRDACARPRRPGRARPRSRQRPHKGVSAGGPDGPPSTRGGDVSSPRWTAGPRSSSRSGSTRWSRSG